jgi:thymidylate synthase
MRQPVLRVEERKLSYQFMAAEAYWILTGDDRVASIAPYSNRIANFSDDGIRFFGAYGPEIVDQLPYVVRKLNEDPLTRQAGLSIWRKNPPPSKDIPCTVAVFFSIREGRLNCHVFMRSSDLWLGLPYDVFNFSMLSHLVCCKLNETRLVSDSVSPGDLYLTAASSHLYETNWDQAIQCLMGRYPLQQGSTPQFMYRSEETFFEWLCELRDTKPGSHLRWWENPDASN